MMDVLFTTRFERSYQDAPAAIKRAFDKQLAFLLENLRHPSLRAKKYDTERWQARIT
jgi:mRNA-degrading endonuclease RelE of RelBE toxin-antitoxin system